MPATEESLQPLFVYAVKSAKSMYVFALHLELQACMLFFLPVTILAASSKITTLMMKINKNVFIIANLKNISTHRNNNNTKLKMSTQTQISESTFIIYNSHGRFFFIYAQIQIMPFLSW